MSTIVIGVLFFMCLCATALEPLSENSLTQHSNDAIPDGAIYGKPIGECKDVGGRITGCHCGPNVYPFPVMRSNQPYAVVCSTWCHTIGSCPRAPAGLKTDCFLETCLIDCKEDTDCPSGGICLQVDPPRSTCYYTLNSTSSM